jgi:glutathione S-transferase
MRAYLRYRRIPYELIISGSREDTGLPEPKVRLLPTFFLPDERGELVAVTDSTPLIRRFEKDFDGRGAIPPDPVMAFIDALLEDYADEWLTKPMFHYRWAHEADARKAGRILPLWSSTAVPDEQHRKVAAFITERQIARLWVVGSNDTTAPVIEESYRRLLRLFDAHLQQHAFLMGGRPGASDFGLFGQLSQLVLFDPTPAAVTLEESPRVYSWVERVEDLSGCDALDSDWLTAQTLPDTLRALLVEVGRVYAPVMLANARAVEGGHERVEATIDGRPWVQKPFPYQAKCLRWTRQARAALTDEARARVDHILDGTGCEALFQGAP